jgi:copper chaperone
MNIHVEGMSCTHCERAVIEALLGLDPNAAVQVDLAGKQVQVDGELSLQQALEALRAEGYEARAAAG